MSKASRQALRSAQATRDNAATAPGRTGPPRAWIGLLAVLVLTMLVFGQAVRFDYLDWDDDENITANPNLVEATPQSLRDIFSLDKGPVMGGYHPVSISTFWLEKRLLGEFDPWWTHLINLLLHCGVVALVWRVMRQLGLGPWPAALGAALFAIHPMRVESVAWATERKDMLLGLFFFSAFSVYIGFLHATAPARRRRLYWTTFALCVAGCFSKVQMVAILPTLLLADFWFARRLLARGTLLRMLPFLLLTLGYGLLNLHTLRSVGTLADESLTQYGPVQRLLVGAFTWCVYLFKAALPHPLSPLYPYPASPGVGFALAGLGFALSVGVFAWAVRMGWRTVVFGCLFFAFNVVLMLQVVSAGQGFLADRYTYIGYFGLFFMAAAGFQSWARARPGGNAATVVAGVWIALLAGGSFHQTGVWRNGATLWTHAIGVVGANSPAVYHYRGRCLLNEGRLDAALADLDVAIRMDPVRHGPRATRGLTYFRKALAEPSAAKSGEYARKAIQDFTQGLAGPAVPPEARSELLSNRGAARAKIGEIDAGLADLGEAIRLNPENTDAYLNRSLAYSSAGRLREAVGDHDLYLKRKPLDADIWYERGAFRLLLNDPAGAIADLTRAIELRPGLAPAYGQRALALLKTGRVEPARADARQARKLGYSFPPADAAALGL
ncbi:MAG: tetratricopeptide repeat protein [Kiritimatiellia bacterium]